MPKIINLMVRPDRVLNATGVSFAKPPLQLEGQRQGKRNRIKTYWFSGS